MKNLKEYGKLNEGKDYSETSWKMDKFMPEDEEVMQEYYDILDDEDKDDEDKKKELIEFFNNNADEEIMKRYMPKGGSITEFVEYIIKTESESEK